ncbi:MAG: hypothetical protein M3Y24_02530 [Acidobacteriota bacterium]|nr:hypothetical protein [Acidobacteriota bacterium]
MAATARKLPFAGLLITTVLLAGDQQAEIRSQLSDVGSALTGSNPADAMTPFSKSFPDYNKLRNYFTGLTSAFSIVNEIDVLDEADTDKDSTATVRWTITLSNGPVSGNGTQRAADIHVRFVREKGKWKIVEFSPIDLFDPAQAQTAKPAS